MIIFLKKAFRSVYYAVVEGRHTTLSFPVELRGKKWILSRRAGLSYNSGHYEPVVQEVLRANLNPGDVFWDVGAHVGYFSLLAHYLVKGGQVVSFEPHPDNFAFLTAIHSLNGSDSNWKMRNAALGHDNALLRFSEGGSSTTGRLSPTGSMEVQCLCGDTVWQEEGSGEVTLIKIDVEGAAGSVLRGMRKLLAAIKPTLLIEMHSETEARQVLSSLPAEYLNIPSQPTLNSFLLADKSHALLKARLRSGAMTSSVE